MVSRRMLLLDRIAALLLALVLLVGGAALIWWWSGRTGTDLDLASLDGLFPDASGTGPVADVVSQPWWGWASTATGVLLVLLGLRWIVAHLRRTGVRRLSLEGSDTSGRLQVSGSGVAGAAAEALTETRGVRSAGGVVVRDRGQLVARLTAVLEPEADLALVARRADEVSGQLAQVLERDDLRCRLELSVGRSRR